MPVDAIEKAVFLDFLRTAEEREPHSAQRASGNLKDTLQKLSPVKNMENYFRFFKKVKHASFKATQETLDVQKYRVLKLGILSPMIIYLGCLF